jgi:hypothetical protein
MSNNERKCPARAHRQRETGAARRDRFGDAVVGRVDPLLELQAS